MDEHIEPPPASPTLMMPSISEPEPSPTIGPAPKSVLNNPVEIPPSPAPSEKQLSYSGDEDYGIYDDLPLLDPSKFSHLSLEEMGVDE